MQDAYDDAFMRVPRRGVRLRFPCAGGVHAILYRVVPVAERDDVAKTSNDNASFPDARTRDNDHTKKSTIMSDDSYSLRLTEDLSYVHPTAPLPSWIKGFFITALHCNDNAIVDACIEACEKLNDMWFRVAYEPHRVDGEKPFTKAEALWIPGCESCAFVALRPDDTDANVALLAKALVDECREGADWVQPTHVARVVPIERCAAELDLPALAKEIVGRHFPPRDDDDDDAEPITFEVHFENHQPLYRYHASDVNRIVASFVPEVGYKVDLKNPQKTILVINAGGSAMMSVVENYDKLFHFNVNRAVHDKLSAHVPRDEERTTSA